MKTKSQFLFLLLILFSQISLSNDLPFIERPSELISPCNEISLYWKKYSNYNQSAMELMSPDKVKYIVIRPSLMPDWWGPQMVQEWAMNRGNSCDIAFHFGIFQEKLFELRSLRYQGAFLRGRNNNIGVLIHGTDISNVEDEIIDLVNYLISTGDYPNLKGIITTGSEQYDFSQVVQKINSLFF